jgi:hypothetical protein
MSPDICLCFLAEILPLLTFKIRSKTMRGSKSMPKVLAHPYLASFLRGDVAGRCDPRKVT